MELWELWLDIVFLDLGSWVTVALPLLGGPISLPSQWANGSCARGPCRPLPRAVALMLGHGCSDWPGWEELI
jgi:hypothetical protein